MAKRVKQKRQQAARKTNWLLIGGIIAVGAVALFALLFLSLQGPEQQTLAEYCVENPDQCVTKGNPDSAVTIIEVSDFGCSHCGTFHKETLPQLNAQYIDNNNINWVVLPYALSANTLPAANAAMCAGEQDAYFEFSEIVFARQLDQATFSRDGLLQVGNDLGLNMSPYQQCLEDGRYNQTISDNVDAARDVGVSATPSFFINGRLLEGAYPFSVFEQRIEAAAN